ncbi:hypothetical protein MSAN_00987200 [Mycena sanguinolenta]|uniref:Uncharacterized protein n=1 Tax=Mycena sanguinolenta TaxID=230812 RepID=A0A8H6YLD9_9AGAR|nr:hypothetical protein MSAN_00987200 [Mycena sanguinolenta]
MPAPCKYCGAPTVVDDAGVVCTSCAELAEPSLVVLASDIDYPTTTTYDGWIPVAPKALKTGRNRYLSGQGKELRDGKNLDEMHWFIKNLARAAFVSGTTERAYNLFEKAMKSGQYRWGRTAKLVAGACISIALRQSGRPDMFPDLALLLGQKVTSLTRAFSSVISVLKIQPGDLPSSAPKSHVSILQSHLSAAIEGSIDSQLPSSLITAVKPLSVSAILATAASLSDLLASSIPPTALAHLPVSATACAVLMWAIEAETRTPLSQLGELAAFLGSRVNVRKPLVMSRYKAIQDELNQRIDKIDWLDHYEPNSGKCGRAKISRRLVVARGLKAVIESERECRRNALDRTGKTATHPEGGESDSDADPQPARPRKRRRLHALQDATRFLLNPLSGPLPASFLAPSSHSTLSLPTYLLTSSLSVRRETLPSRLQLLSAARGGVGPDEIHDDELFDDGELEKIIRTDEHEIAELRTIFDWPEGGDVEEAQEAPARSKPRKRASAAKDAPKPTTSSRLNAAAVACFFADEKTDEDNEFGSLLRLDDVDHGKDSEFIIATEGDDTGAFIGLPRMLVDSFAEEDDEDEDALFPNPSSDDRYAQEI